MKKRKSKKHHYLPRHYLKGFTNNKNKFYVYDKQTDKIFETSPGNAFFENKLNTTTLPNGESSDFLEGLYADTENQFWPTLDKIRKSSPNIAINLFDKMNLFLFLLFLHWRLPSNIEYAESLSKESFIEGTDIDFFHIVGKDGKNVPEEFLQVIKNSSAFKKTIKMALPFAPFYKDNDWHIKLNKWRFFYAGDGKSWHIVGDNPIVTNGKNDHDPVNCLKEFVFPVSGKILLTNIDNPINKDLPPEFMVQHSAAIIKRARRFVACQSEDLLRMLIKYYKVHTIFDKEEIIISTMFEMLNSSK